MPPGAPFLRNLAVGLRDALGADLSTALVLLPTRRAIRDLTDAFLWAADGAATLLPIMRTLGDIDENEPPFEPGEIALHVPQSIHQTRRRFELANIVAHKMSKEGEAPDAVSALAMTEPLLSLMNDLAMEELGVEALAKLDEKLDGLPAHFQDAAEFVKIIATHWPQHLADLNLTEPMTRRVNLLDMATRLWREKPPNYPVIVAGSTGTLPATARLIKTVAEFDKGLVILPALDTHIDDHSFARIDDQHPQASLKTLLTRLQLTRENVPDWPGVKLNHKASMRTRLLSEALIPADATSDWPERIARVRESVSSGNPIKDGLSGLSLIDAKTEEEEATTIAVIMRETLETPDKTCALVTPDPSLARRVRSKLSRWNVEVDSSAGEPLEETLHGSFLSLTAEVAMDPLDPIALSALIKHQLFAFGSDAAAQWSSLEKAVFRGPRPRSIAAIEAKIERRSLSDCEGGIALLKALHDVFEPLHCALSGVDRTAPEFAALHTGLIETLAGGPSQIWREEAGEKAQGLMREMLEFGELLPPLDGASYLRLVSNMMRGRVVRPRYGTHDNLQILGPLEARMLEADTIILGGLNEGVWPAHPAPHPILSRGMRKQIGLTAPERRFGLAAHDFAVLAAKPNVILTRAGRTSDGPSVMSRWLWRLKTLALGALGEEVEAVLAPDQPYLDWARALDQAPETPSPARRPAPKPPLSARWPQDRKGRRLSVTQIQTWIRDPYSIYAKQVLDLKSLDPMDQELGGREYGNAVHKALERFAKDGDNKSVDWLEKALSEELKSAGYADHTFSRHAVRMREMSEWLVSWRAERKAQGWQLFRAEKKAEMQLKTGGDDFTLSGVPDRIEKAGDQYAILDFKTGTPASPAVVEAGFDPQLPLLAAMLNAGAFGATGEAQELAYVKPNGRDPKKRHLTACRKKTVEEVQADALAALGKLIDHFDEPDTPYHSQPRAQYTNPYGDYDHLARRAEWAKLGKDAPEGGGS